jgi:hypothetical protein
METTNPVDHKIVATQDAFRNIQVSSLALALPSLDIHLPLF